MLIIGCKAYYHYLVGVSQSGPSDETIRDNQIYQNRADRPVGAH